jgi:hypothetical protein
MVLHKFFLVSSHLLLLIEETGLAELGINESFRRISTIIERDSKYTTYKFALLRAVIEISQEYKHLKREEENRVVFPTGLIVEKWLLYYYPLIESTKFIPQQNGEKKEKTRQISFRKKFEEITSFYRDKGGFSAFWSDYQSQTVPQQIEKTLTTLVKNLYNTITEMPMRYIGGSISNREYSIFKFSRNTAKFSLKGQLNSQLLIDSFGSFSFEKHFFNVFQYLGSFISGEDSLLYKWAKFSVRADTKGELTVEGALKKLGTMPETERLTRRASTAYKGLFSQQKFLKCTWSGKLVKDFRSMHIDHIIPFAVWKNNDLWNLIPVRGSVNLEKKDRVPLPEFIEQKREDIMFYWDVLRSRYRQQFDRQLFVSVTGEKPVEEDWKEVGLEGLKEKCDYLINTRGIEGWKIQ